MHQAWLQVSGQPTLPALLRIHAQDQAMKTVD
jgi:hypothetical protein